MRRNTWLTPVTRMNQMLELSDQDFKATIRKMLQQTIKNSLETKKLKSQQRRRSCFWKRTKWKLWN